MREFGIIIFAILAIAGLSLVLGIATRSTERNDKDKDDVFMTIVRGLGTLMLLFGALQVIAIVIYLITLPFGLWD